MNCRDDSIEQPLRGWFYYIKLIRELTRFHAFLLGVPLILDTSQNPLKLIKFVKFAAAKPLLKPNYDLLRGGNLLNFGGGAGGRVHSP